MNENESKNLNSIDLKNSIVDLDRLKSILESVKEIETKSSDRESRELTNVYTKIVKLISEGESKSYNMLSDLNDNVNYGAWSEEERIFLDKTILKGLFQDEGWVYLIVDLIALKIANCPLKVYKKTKSMDGKEIIGEAPDHPFNKNIETPNPMQDYFDWMYCIVVDLTLCGDAFIFKGFGTENMYQMPSETMTIRLDAKGEPNGYDRFQSSFDLGRKFLRAFTLDEMIHIRKPNPSTYLQGFSPFTPGRKSVLFNRYSLEYLNNYYLKGASSGMILEMSKETNPANALRLLKSFEAAYLGRKNQRRVKVLPAGVTAKDFGESLADQQLKDYLAMNKEDILALLKVPKHEVGLQTAGSLGSEEYRTAIKNFWEATLKPTMGIVKGKLNKRLKVELGPEYFLDFDLSGVEALKDNDIQKGTVADGMLKTHTVNEVRDILYNLAPIDGGDVVLSLIKPAAPFSGFSMSPGNMPDNMPDNPVTSPGGEKDDSKVVVPEEELGLFVHQADSLIKSSGDWFERRKKKIEETTKKPILEITDLFLKLFADQAIEVIKNLDKIVRKSVNLNDEKNVRKVIDAAIAGQIETLRDPIWKKQKSEIASYIAMTFDHPAYASDQALIDQIKTGTMKNVEKFVNERTDYIFEKLNETTSNDIYTLIKNAAQSSDTIHQMAEQIKGRYASADQMYYRGDRIARTEVLTTMSKAQDLATKEAAKKIPGLQKMWVSTLDNRTRGNPGGLYPIGNDPRGIKGDHWGLHGQIRNENQAFEDPHNKDLLMFPRDPSGLPGSVINCRCTHIVLPAKEMSKFVSTEREAKPNA